VVLLSAAVLAAAIFTTRPAGAVKPFMEQFKTMYVKPKTKDHAMLIFNEAVDKKGCTICHAASSTKKSYNAKTFNAYGTQVKKYLSKGDGNNATKIKSALARVSKLPSDPKDSSSPTFGERLKQGKLPVGEIHVRSKAAADTAQN
jgi:hypothetical protein